MSQQAAPKDEKKPQQQVVDDKKRLYVRWDVSDESLKSKFDKFGKVVEARVVRGYRGTPRSFGFVTFESEAEAAQALQNLQKQELGMPLTVEPASGAGRAAPRAARAPAANNNGGAAPAANAETGADAGRGRGRGRGGRGGRGRGRGGRGGDNNRDHAGAPRAPRRDNNAPANGGAQQADRRRANNDPNFGKIVRLTPDPINQPIAPNAQLIEVAAGERRYRNGATNVKAVATLQLNADPSKGPFNSEFKLGPFPLKLISVNVSAKPNDTRVSAKVLNPATDALREIYFRHHAAETPADVKYGYRFLQLRAPDAKDNKDNKDAGRDLYFVAIDSITLDPATSLWKTIKMSLVSAYLPPRPPRAAADQKAGTQ